MKRPKFLVIGRSVALEGEDDARAGLGGSLHLFCLLQQWQEPEARTGAPPAVVAAFRRPEGRAAPAPRELVEMPVAGRRAAARAARAARTIRRCAPPPARRSSRAASPPARAAARTARPAAPATRAASAPRAATVTRWPCATSKLSPRPIALAGAASPAGRRPAPRPTAARGPATPTAPARRASAPARRPLRRWWRACSWRSTPAPPTSAPPSAPAPAGAECNTCFQNDCTASRQNCLAQ